MKIASTIARYLLGLMFTIFGLNGFLHFIPPPPSTGLALQFQMALGASHYWAPIFALQLAGGLLLLSGRFVPIALVLLGPVIVNILIFHTLMDPKGIPPGLVAFLLWLLVFYSVRSAFAGVFASQVPETASQVPGTAARIPETA